MGVQLQRGVIVSSLVNFDGITGFTLQVNDSSRNQFVFGYGGGTQSVPNVTFPLEEGKWSYVTAVVNRDFIKMYANGMLLATVGTGGLPFKYSDGPLIIGNSSLRDGHFRGYIKEVKVTEGNKNENEILNTGRSLYGTLNAGVQ